jgi:hypothetical protein
VTLRVVLPPQPDEELKRFAQAWGPAHPYNPRRGMAE